MFLGYISSKAPQHKLSSLESYLGGCPSMLPSACPPEEAYLICGNCHEQMNFLMQIYCPLESSSNHRALYFFVCLHPPCQSAGKNWRVYRCQIPCEFVSNQNTNTSDWCVDPESSDDGQSWGEADEASDQVQEPEIDACSSGNSQILLNSHIVGPFEPHYVDVYEEEDSSQSSTTTEPNGSNYPSSAFELWCQEEEIEQEFVEEDDNAASGTFSGQLQNYLTTRSEYGCEAIRYSWSGKPVFDGPIPKHLKQHLTCQRCGSPRVFEVQLFPTLNNSLFLHSPTICNKNTDHFEASELNQDWILKITTVLVFSCSISCSTTKDGWTEECVVVQTDSNVTNIITPKV